MTTLNDAAIEAAAEAIIDTLYDMGGSDSTRAAEAIAHISLTAALPHLRKDWEAERSADLSTRSLVDMIEALGICDELGHVQSCGYDENEACFCSTLPQRLAALLAAEVPT